MPDYNKVLIIIQCRQGKQTKGELSESQVQSWREWKREREKVCACVSVCKREKDRERERERSQFSGVPLNSLWMAATGESLRSSYCWLRLEYVENERAERTWFTFSVGTTVATDHMTNRNYFVRATKPRFSISFSLSVSVSFLSLILVTLPCNPKLQLSFCPFTTNISEWPVASRLLIGYRF